MTSPSSADMGPRDGGGEEHSPDDDIPGGTPASGNLSMNAGVTSRLRSANVEDPFRTPPLRSIEGSRSPEGPVSEGDEDSTDEARKREEDLKRKAKAKAARDKRKRDKEKEEHVEEDPPQKKKTKSSSEPGHGFRVTQGFNRSYLETEVQELRSSLRNVDLRDLTSTLANVESARREIDSHPLGRNTVHTACDLNRHLAASLECHGGIQILVRLHRLSHVRAQGGVWRWLEGDVRDAVIMHLRAPTETEANWLTGLTDAIKAMLLDRTPTKIYVPETFGLLDQPPILRQYQLVNKYRHRYFLDGEAALEEVIPPLVSIIISSWTGDNSDLEQKRAWFINSITKSLGDEVLTTDFIWNMVVNFRPIYALPRSVAYGHPQSRDSLRPLIQAIEEHPINVQGSPEHSLYDLYCGLLHGKVSAHDAIQPLSSSSNAWAVLKQLLHLSLEYIAHPEATFTHPFQIALQEDPDYYLPFREHSPGRILSRSHTGPYSWNTITQKRGIFSALVWRGCTYRSDFARDKGMVFSDSHHLLSEVDAVVQERGDATFNRDDPYFCRKNPYGQPAGRRSIEVAITYWSSVDELAWDELVLSHPTFLECFDIFRPPGRETTRFPQLGPLGAFLLTGDLAYAGVCQKPTDAECAQMMVKVHRGGLEGLKKLGFIYDITPGTPLKEATAVVRDGLQELFDGVRGLLGTMDYEGEIDFILLEHLLCKFQRALSNDLLSL
ncbi:hypothetical protein BKA70DRAFT_1431185 [Coprinopsis sp. MPI-PUGE-AT-0042]|nr:hypothetical protein BKA70DRAFT_1431185 [Coprinopsis sp. MPI-PUGE-AT-0042]